MKWNWVLLQEESYHKNTALTLYKIQGLVTQLSDGWDIMKLFCENCHKTLRLVWLLSPSSFTVCLFVASDWSVSVALQPLIGQFQDISVCLKSLHPGPPGHRDTLPVLVPDPEIWT